MKVKLRKEVKWFAELMELKLRDNDHRTSWKLSTNRYLQKRISDELKELQNQKFPYDKIEECIDVANFSMMLADNITHDRG